LGNPKHLAFFVFSDLVGSSEVAYEARDPGSLYRKYLKHFKIAVNRSAKFAVEHSLNHHGAKVVVDEKDLSWFGDGAILIAACNDPKEMNNLLNCMLMYSVQLKLLWLLGEYNMERLKAGHCPRDVAVGIHLDFFYHSDPTQIEWQNHIAFLSNNKTFGYGLNVAKRIEELSRRGESSQILLSSNVASRLAQAELQYKSPHDFWEFTKRARLSQPRLVEQEGSSLRYAAFEIREPVIPAIAWNEFAATQKTGLYRIINVLKKRREYFLRNYPHLRPFLDDLISCKLTLKNNAPDLNAALLFTLAGFAVDRIVAKNKDDGSDLLNNVFGTANLEYWKDLDEHINESRTSTSKDWLPGILNTSMQLWNRYDLAVLLTTATCSIISRLKSGSIPNRPHKWRKLLQLADWYAYRLD